MIKVFSEIYASAYFILPNPKFSWLLMNLNTEVSVFVGFGVQCNEEFGGQIVVSFWANWIVLALIFLSLLMWKNVCGELSN